MLSRTPFSALLALVSLVGAQTFAVGGAGRFPCSATNSAGLIVVDASLCTAAAMSASQLCPPDSSVLGQVDSVDGGPGSKANGTRI